MTEYILSEKMRAWASAHGWNAELHLDYFLDYIANKTGKPYKDLDAAFRNCVRADWGGLRRQAQYLKAKAGPTFDDALRERERTRQRVEEERRNAAPMPESVKQFIRRRS